MRLLSSVKGVKRIHKFNEIIEEPLQPLLLFVVLYVANVTVVNDIRIVKAIAKYNANECERAKIHVFVI